MNATTNLSQQDVDTLFKIDHRCAGLVNSDLAARLTMVGYIERKEPLQSTASTMDADGERYIGITHRGRMFMAAIREGLETRWQEWKP